MQRNDTMTMLITSTSESTGKTAVAIALAEIARDRGATVGYMKPKGTRLESTIGKTRDEDPLLAAELLDLDAELETLEPVVYSPTFLKEAIRGREDPAALRDRITQSYETLAADGTQVFIEGGGSFTTGGVINLTDRDIAAAISAPVLLVVPYEQAHDVDSILEATTVLDDTLSGILFNAVPDAAFDELVTDVVPFLEGRGIRVFGAIPRDPELAGVSIDELAAELGATVLTTSVPLDEMIQRFIVGSMGAEEAFSQFRRTRNAMVITGGDRPEVHIAAIDAPGVKCVLLTGGLRPPEAVIGRAEEANVPLLLIRTDTTTTINRTEDIIRSGRTRDSTTISRMRELLETYADVDAMLELSSSDANP